MASFDDVLPQRGACADLIRQHDWSATPLGPMPSWPQSLRSALSICIGSAFPIAIYWGDELTLLYNDAWSSIPGQKHPWAMGRPGREVWPEIWDSIGPQFESVMRTGEATYTEDGLLLMRRHGYTEECYFNFTFTPIRGERGRVEGVFNAVTETTYRVVSERRAQVVRDLGSAVSAARSVDEACMLAGKSLANATADAPFCAIYVVDQDDGRARLAATAGIEVGHPAAPPSIELADERACWPLGDVWRSPRVASVDDLRERFEGDLPGGVAAEPATSALVAPIMASSNEPPLGFVVIGASPRRAIDEQYRDFASRIAAILASAFVHARALAEERRRSEALAAIDRAKTVFFSNVSHEFRTPLTLMLGPLEDAVSSTRALDGAELAIVHRNALRLLKLVNTLLDFARTEAGRARASYVATDLPALTADLASAFRSAMERGGLRFEVDCPPLSTPVFVDRDMWEKIVLNLLSNALKFTFDGSVRIGLRETADGIELEVRDTGLGIPEQELPRLFERFHRVEGARGRTHEGSGIGLALVRDLVKLHGGEISVESRVNVGTTVRLWIPRGSAHLPQDRVGTEREHGSKHADSYLQEALRWLPPERREEEEADDETPDAAASDTRARVLVVDDNADMRHYLARLLREHWSVETAVDGVDALELLRAGPFDLVVSDVMMPRLDGFGLVKGVRSDPRTAAIPLILLSARAGEEAVADGLRSGADDYLVKPFSAATLVVRVEAQLAAARAREAVRRHVEGERERLRALFEVSPAVIAVLRGQDLVIELANARYLDSVGRSSDIIGKPLLEAVPELRGQGFDTLLRRVLDTGAPCHAKEALVRVERHRPGELTDVYMDFVYAPMPDPDGTITRVLVHAFEVTELVEQRRAAERANRLKDEFVATMSHELRTPLNAILGWATLLRMREHDEASRAKALATIERNARAQLRIVEDILDVSRIVGGKLGLSVGRVDVGPIIAAAVDVLRPAAEGKGIALDVSVADDCGAVRGDADRLQQVIWNLLSNAVRFTPPGGAISLSSRRRPDAIEIVVRDTGIGIHPEHLPHVFERFWQVDGSTARRHGGLGLGLAIVRHLVELHGGTVSASSEGIGRGAAFVVSLPTRGALRPSAIHGDPAASVDASLSTDTPLDGLHVLVVDDDEDSRELVATVLGTAGAAVATADSARVALDLVERRRPDVLVSDIGMPEHDGYWLIRGVGARPDASASVPAIALTAYARADDARLALAAGFQEYLAKPVEPAKLTEMVARVAGACERTRA